MKQKFGSIVVSGSGKLGGQVITQIKGQSVLSTKRRAVSMPSLALANQNILFKNVSNRWSSLSDSQRLIWRQANYFGMSGITLYRSCNINRQLLSLSIIDNFPGLAIIPAPAPASVGAYYGINQFIFTLQSLVQSGYSLKIYASNQKSPGISDVKKGNRLLYIASNASGLSFDLFSAYNSVFNMALVLNRNISIRMVTVHNASGLVSTSVYQLISVSAAPYMLALPFDTTTAQSIYRSTNFGKSFSSLGPFSNFQQYQFGYSDWSGLVLLQAFGTSPANGFLRSTDFGASFSVIVNPLPNYPTGNIVRGIDSNLYCAATQSNTSTFLLKSTNNGSSWSSVLTIDSTHGGRQLVLCSDGSIVVAAFKTGVGCKVTRLAAPYTSASLVLTVANAVTIQDFRKFSDGSLLLSTKSGSASVQMHRSSDNGVNWSQVYTSSTNSNLGIAFESNSGGCYQVLVNASSASLLLYSNNKGASWSSIKNLSNAFFASSWATSADGLIYMFNLSGQNAYVSNDNGANWNLVTLSIGAVGYRCALNIPDGSFIAGSITPGRYLLYDLVSKSIKFFTSNLSNNRIQAFIGFFQNNFSI